MFLGNGDIVQVPMSEANEDMARVAACKSKKVKGISEMMKALSA